MKKSSKNTDLLELLYSKYTSDPQGFRSYLPDVAQILDVMKPSRRSTKSPFGLTQRERDYHQRRLAELLEKMRSGAIPSGHAIKGLEHCAILIQDDNLPEEADYETLVKLLKCAIGKSPGSFKKSETIRVDDNHPVEVAVNRISLVRGVSLALDRETRLVAITISPHRAKQRRKMLAFVGIGQDIKEDVALRHDDYLTERGPHAAS